MHVWPPFSPCCVGEGKKAAISKQTCFSQKRVRSYIVLALGKKTKMAARDLMQILALQEFSGHLAFKSLLKQLVTRAIHPFFGQKQTLGSLKNL